MTHQFSSVSAGALPLTQIMEVDRRRLEAEIASLRQQRLELADKEAGLQRRLKAIAAYAKTMGADFPGYKKVTRKSRRTAILELLASRPSGLRRIDIITELDGKGNRTDEASISNALSSLKRDEKIIVRDHLYFPV